MKRNLLVAALATTILIPSANASLVVINDGTGVNLPNQGKATIEAWLAADVATYNGSNDPDLPTPVGLEIFRVNTSDPSPAPGYPSFGPNTLSITIPTGGYEYVTLHWGGNPLPHGNQPGERVNQSFYIGTVGGPVPASFTFTAPDGHGLSYYDVFTPIPEPSTYLAGAILMLPFALGTLRSWRRKCTA